MIYPTNGPDNLTLLLSTTCYTGSEVGIEIALNLLMKEKTLSKQLLSLKKQTSWSWEQMYREFFRVMAHEGPSHATLYRYARGKTKQPNVIIERYVREAIHKLTAELAR